MLRSKWLYPLCQGNRIVRHSRAIMTFVILRRHRRFYSPLYKLILWEIALIRGTFYGANRVSRDANKPNKNVDPRKITANQYSGNHALYMPIDFSNTYIASHAIILELLFSQICTDAWILCKLRSLGIWILNLTLIRRNPVDERIEHMQNVFGIIFDKTNFDNNHHW